MHLVFATSLVPDGSPATGYEIANAAILDALRRAGVRVTVLGFTWPGRKPSDPGTISLGELDVRTDTATPMQKIAWLAKAVREGLTVSSVKLRTVSEATVSAALAKAGPFDGFVVNAVQFAGAFESILARKPSLFVAHNVEFRSAEENAAAADGAVQRYLYQREARLLKSMEARLCHRARFVFTLAEEDRAALGVNSDLRSAALPLVTRLLPPEPARPREIVCDAALIGTWTWQPNRIGLDWFLADVVPHMPTDFRIHIAGSVPGSVSSRHPGVRFVGRVPDAAAFIRGGAVVPLISRAGTGVQLKTIETFEYGLPSVATTRSLRGINHLPANCVVADDPRAFAAALVQSAAKRSSDVDGRSFHAEQRAALDGQLRLGLDRFATIAEQVSA